ncbi:ROK family protein [Aeromonas dhakensis]|uniref:ROK family protein n=1 Tax=Aeromonas dhakensis TaxID=196024 RepID=UPI0038CFA217
MQIARYCQHGINCGRDGCLETVASLSAIKKRARVFFKQQGADPAALAEGRVGTAQLLARYQQGDLMIRAMVDEGARAIGLSLYNFLNILNINRIWLYGRSCGFGEEWLQTIIHQPVRLQRCRQRHPHPFRPAQPCPAGDGDWLSLCGKCPSTASLASLRKS